MRNLIARLCVSSLLALCAVPALAVETWPALAGGKCGLLRSVPMPKMNAALYYWRCADGSEVSFHVRRDWEPAVDDVSVGPDVYRAHLQALRARSKADKLTRFEQGEIAKARTFVRGQTV